MAEKLIIVGAGSAGREIACFLDALNEKTPTWEILGFIDDNPNALDGKRCRYKILGSIADHMPQADVNYAMGMALVEDKQRVAEILLPRGAKFATICGLGTYLPPDVHLGQGVVFYSHIIVSSNITIGNFATILTSSVGHDVTIGPYATVGPFCCIGGGVEIGKSAYLGANVSIAPGKKVGEDAIVGMGSVVIRNVAPNTTVFGNPAKRIPR